MAEGQCSIGIVASRTHDGAPVDDPSPVATPFAADRVTLFAALDIGTGEVFAQCKKRHRHRELLGFLQHIDASVPARLDVHLVVHNYAIYKHPAVRALYEPTLPSASHSAAGRR